ncbi:MAG TPA: hypothetical protein VLL25_14720 [Acidimicrobiales bacterium]|nr:hypothetical protein [Acidimicrobiales bacterium]
MSDLWAQVTAAVIGAVVPVLVAFVNDWLQKRKPAEPVPYDQEAAS